MKKVVNGRSQPAVASVSGERLGELRRADLSFEIGDSLVPSLRFAVDRILQTLDQLLQMGDALLERVELLLLRAARRWSSP
jgi:hypothetical protein